MKVEEWIKEGLRCFDGATGTMLIQLGLKAGECPEMVSEEVMTKVHKDYIDAGSQYITTNTFGANRPKLAKFKLDSDVAKINRRNAGVARKAARGRGVLVAGDIGPTGELIKPYGDYTRDMFIDVFSEQAKALAESEVDLIIIETMTSIEELESAIHAARSVTVLPVIATMTFDKDVQGRYRTMMGVTPEAAVKVMEEKAVDACGANCTLSPSDMTDLVREFRKLTHLPLIFQPNAGKPKIVDDKTVYEPIPDLEKSILQIIAAGADIVGGCCGTDPKYIRVLGSLLK